jgi:hypothetical protein
MGQSGCTDWHANNYDPLAIDNDGSCTYPYTNLPLTYKCLIDSTNLSETSGIANADNNFWTHVDDSDPAIYRIDTLSMTIFQRLEINGATNYDWEDISADSLYIFVGDVGNNYGDRTNLRFYRILKSNITPVSTIVNADHVNVSYADQVDFTPNHNHNFYDCEAFFIVHDSIHMFTKGWVNKWTKHYVLPATPGTHVAQLVDSFNVQGLITSAAIQGDTLVVLLGLNFSGGNNCFVWMLSDFNGYDYFGGNKRKFAIGSPFTTGQTEGICFKDTCRGYITNERYSVNAQLREFNLNPYLTPPPAPPQLTLSADSITQNIKACSDTGYSYFTISNTAAAGGLNLSFTLTNIPPYVTVSPMTGSIVPGDSIIVTAIYHSGLLTGGLYSANIVINSNDNIHPNGNIYCSLAIDSNPCLEYVYTTDTCTGFSTFNSSSINTPTDYYWNFGDGDSSDIANPVHFFNNDGNYTVMLVGCNNSGCDTVIQNVHASITGPKATNCYPATQSYCCGRGITHFQLTGSVYDIINNSSNDASAGYEDFTCSDTAMLFTNNPYSLNCSTAMTDAEYLKVWIDLNNDGMLDSVAELLYESLDTIPPLHSGTLTIPALPTNVYGVPVRLRVASDFQSPPQPCTDLQSGQAEDYSVILNFSTGISGLSSENEFRIYPNPFSGETNVSYAISKSSNVKLVVYNSLGKIVEVLFNSVQSPGSYQYPLNTIQPGIYFVHLCIDERCLLLKCIKLR